MGVPRWGVIPQLPASSLLTYLTPVAPGCGICWRIHGDGFWGFQGLRTGWGGEFPEMDPLGEGLDSRQGPESNNHWTQNQRQLSSPPGP